MPAAPSRSLGSSNSDRTAEGSALEHLLTLMPRTVRASASSDIVNWHFSAIN